jgi:hypothetical protein
MSHLTVQDLSVHFNLPIADAAKKFGVCATVLKKICRSVGIPRWPYRKITSIDRMINTLENCLEAHSNARIIQIELITLRAHKQYIIDHPETIDKRSKKKRKRNDPVDYNVVRKQRKIVDENVDTKKSADIKLQTLDPTPIFISDYAMKDVPKKSNFPSWFEEELKHNSITNKFSD